MSESSSKKVLVTGYDGYIGAVLVERLIARGHQVRGLDTCYFQDCSFPQPSGPTEVVTKDIRDISLKDLADVGAIIHLAALSNDPMGELDADLTLQINFEASARLAQLAKTAGVQRFLFASSCSMYGSSTETIANEDAPFNPLTAYALSKVKTEAALSQLADGNFSPTFLRNATAYGMSPKLRFDLVLNNFVGCAITTGKIAIMSDGTPWRPLAHVEDIASAFIAALEAPIETIHHQAFNIGQNAENYQVRDIAEAVRQVVPGSEVTYAAAASPDARSYRVDFTKVQRALPAFQPRWTIERGARQLYEALTRSGITHEDFQGRGFVRLEQLKYLLSTGMIDAELRWSSLAKPAEIDRSAA